MNIRLSSVLRSIGAFFVAIFMVPGGLCIANSAPNFIQQVDSLNEEAWKYYNRNFPSALTIASQARAISITHDYKKGLVQASCIIAMVQANTNKSPQAITLLDALEDTVTGGDAVTLMTFYSAMAVCRYFNGGYDEAVRYHQQALLICPAGANSDRYAYECLLLAKAYMKLSKPDSALLYYEQAKKVINTTGDKELLAWAQGLLGEVFYAQRLYNKAIACQNESIFYFEQLNHLRGLAAGLLHKANIFYMQSKDDSAKHLYFLTLDKFQLLGDSNGMAICHANLSRTLLDLDRVDEAIAHARKALSAVSPGTYPTLEAGIYQQLGDIYGELGQLQKAVDYVQKAMLLARTGNNKVAVKNCYKSLSELYETMGRPSEAYKYLLAAYRIKDSIQPAIYSKQLAEMETKYKTAQKESEIKLLKQQGQIDILRLKEQESTLAKQQYLLLASVVSIFLIVLVVLYSSSRRKLLEKLRHQQTIRETEEKERMRIGKDIHDELGSGLAKIRFLSELAVAHSSSQQPLSGSLRSISETSAGLVENMRDLIWAMNPENTTVDNLVARIREYCHDYLEEFPVEPVFDTPMDVPTYKISKEVNRNVYMIVKESLQNIVKHASATEVHIKIRLLPQFILEISDNGRGYDPFGHTEGNGLKNITARSQALGARLHMTSMPGKGSQLVLEFAMKEVA